MTALLLLELSPVPRQLYAGTIPAPFHRIAEDPRSDVRVLALPIGVRDGTSSLGNFNPLTQYQQTVHGKRLVGGYLSRVTPRQKQSLLRYPVLDALDDTERTGSPVPLAEAQRRRAYASRDRFLLNTRMSPTSSPTIRTPRRNCARSPRTCCGSRR